MKILLKGSMFKEVVEQLPETEKQIIAQEHRWGVRDDEKVRLDISEFSDESLKLVYDYLDARSAGDRSVMLSRGQVQQWIDIKSDPSGARVTKLENLPSAMKAYLATHAPNRYLFYQAYDGNFLPAFVSNITYHHAEESCPAFVSVDLSYICVASGHTSSERGNRRGYSPRSTDGISIHHADISGKMVGEILSDRGYYVETPVRLEAYENEVRRFLEFEHQCGLQMNVMGKAKGLNRWYGSDFISAERDGIPAKMVVDPKEGEAPRTATECKYWEDKKADDDKEPKLWQIPVHPYLLMFDLTEHANYAVHINNAEPYVYDTKVGDKLVLPQDVKDLLEILIEHASVAFSDIIAGKAGGAIILCQGVPGTGKCHGKGTKILMYNGEVKNVEDIQVGDLLMGDDSHPRSVLSLAHGRDELFQIEPTRYGDPFVVNKEHVMVLYPSPKKKTSDTSLVELPLCKYMALTNGKRQHMKLIRTGVTFHNREVHYVDPYWLGLWLGDGGEGYPSITSMSPEIVQYINDYAVSLGLTVSVKDQEDNRSKVYSIVGTICGEGHNNKLIEQMDKLGIRWNKHIPQRYLAGKIRVRKELLAGLVDTDGNKTANGCYEITQKRKELADGIVFLARSLGYSVSIKKKIGTIKKRNFSGLYWKVIISGAHDLPLRLAYKQSTPCRKQIKNHLVSGFKVSPMGIGDYYGFTLDGNGRYLLGDFTITHNTLTAEVYSEVMKRPLYKVQASQLGIGIDRLEKKLQEVLGRAEKWGRNSAPGRG